MTLLWLVALVPWASPGPDAPANAVAAKQHQSPQAADGRDCTACHREDGWRQVVFDHETTQFPLRGAHADRDCRLCHRELHNLMLDRSCGSCHVDVHAGRLGTSCQRCHDDRSFVTGAGVVAHGQTRFPLMGRHAAVPCDKCHQARADRTFAGVVVQCATCHRHDAARTAGRSADHAPLGPEPDCQRCHTPMGWARARFPQHDGCFVISGGAHGRFTCRNCHTAVPALNTGGCSSFTAQCTQCHRPVGPGARAQGDMDNKHAAVAGYQPVDRKCYECHSAGR